MRLLFSILFSLLTVLAPFASQGRAECQGEASPLAEPKRSGCSCCVVACSCLTETRQPQVPAAPGPNDESRTLQPANLIPVEGWFAMESVQGNTEKVRMADSGGADAARPQQSAPVSVRLCRLRL